MKKLYGLMIAGVFNLFLISKAYAVCPICTVFVGAGIGLSQWLGIDDTITGLWVGGLTVSLIIWTTDWMNRRDIYFRGRKTIITVVYYLLIVAPLYYPLHIMGHPLNVLWGVDKLLLGIVVGSVFFFGGSTWYFYLKKKNGGHAYFPFQKVVMPVAPLIILSAVFYFITA